MYWCSGFWGMPLVADDTRPLTKGAGGDTLLVNGPSLRRRAKRVDHLPSYRQPRITVHALVTASRNAGGVSRHPALVYTPTCRTDELQATPSNRPCTCHCLVKRRRRFEALVYSPTCRTVENDANRRLRRFASFSQRYKQLV